jgi:hypothetical protein
MNRLRTGLFVALAGASTIAGAAAVPASAEPAAAAGTTAYGLTTDDRIVTIDTAAADLVTRSVRISGLTAPGETVIGIDRRPNGGALYAVGKAGTTGRLYTVDPTTGVATFVAKLTVAPNAAGNGSCPGQAVGDDIVLSGTDFGFDFNPVPDALRIVSDTGQSLRALPTARNVPRTATADNPATSQPAVLGATFCDQPLRYSGVVAEGVTAAAYTNNDADPATMTTSLLALDTALDDLVTFVGNPNNGIVSKVADLDQPTGPLAGFDIRTADGIDTGYVALTKANGGTKLYGIDLATGETTAIGSVGAKNALKGLAL